MGVERMRRGNLSIATFAGKAEPEHRGRTNVQITDLDSRTFVLLTLDQWVDLCCFIRRLDRMGQGLLELPEWDDDP